MPDHPPRVAGRDKRLDFFRGLALVMIFINHVPGTVWENFTSRNFGFSDAAEGFVLMSGIAAGLAYSKGFWTPTWAAARKIWRRAWTLYLVHLLTTSGPSPFRRPSRSGSRPRICCTRIRSGSCSRSLWAS